MCDRSIRRFNAISLCNIVHKTEISFFKFIKKDVKLSVKLKLDFPSVPNPDLEVLNKLLLF